MKRIYWFLNVGILSIIPLLTGCTPERTFSDTDLLIDIGVMPKNWALHNLYTLNREEDGYNEEGEKSGADITFYKIDTPYLVRGGQTVYRYRSARRAAWHYRRLEKGYFTPNVRHTPPIIPEGFVFSSSTADQWRFGCADSTFSPTPEFGDVSTICQYLAQYDEFLVYAPITTQVDDQIMISMDDVYSFVEAIDLKMAQYLKP